MHSKSAKHIHFKLISFVIHEHHELIPVKQWKEKSYKKGWRNALFDTDSNYESEQHNTSRLKSTARPTASSSLQFQWYWKDWEPLFLRKWLDNPLLLVMIMLKLVQQLWIHLQPPNKAEPRRNMHNPASISPSVFALYANILQVMLPPAGLQGGGNSPAAASIHGSY